MPKEHPLITNIKARIERKRSELAGLKEKRSAKADVIDTVGRELAILDVAILGIEEGIKDDEQSLADAKPKFPRVRKAKPQEQGA